LPEPKPPLPAVKEIMTTPPVAIDPDLRVDVAIETMRSHDVRRLPVISESGHLAGIITISQALIAEAKCRNVGDPLPQIRDFMTDYVYTVDPDASLTEAARIMVGQHIGSLPVVENHRVIGMITESDIFKYLVTWLES
jgi:acetoin utilization protein AcuB